MAYVSFDVACSEAPWRLCDDPLYANNMPEGWWLDAVETWAGRPVTVVFEADTPTFTDAHIIRNMLNMVGAGLPPLSVERVP